MSISNELSSDLAAALLTDRNNDEPVDTKQRVAIVAEVHSILRRLTAEERKERRRAIDAIALPEFGQ
jgi:hypothetical protein